MANVTPITDDSWDQQRERDVKSMAALAATQAMSQATDITLEVVRHTTIATLEVVLREARTHACITDFCDVIARAHGQMKRRVGG